MAVYTELSEINADLVVRKTLGKATMETASIDFYPELDNKMQNTYIRYEDLGQDSDRTTTYINNVIESATTNTYVNGVISSSICESYIDGVVHTNIDFTYVDGVMSSSDTYINGVFSHSNTYVDGVLSHSNTYVDGVLSHSNTYVDGVLSYSDTYVDGVTTNSTTESEEDLGDYVGPPVLGETTTPLNEFDEDLSS